MIFVRRSESAGFLPYVFCKWTLAICVQMTFRLGQENDKNFCVNIHCLTIILSGVRFFCNEV